MTPRPPNKSLAASQELAALKRAAKTALQLARVNETSCHVEIDWRIVDIAAQRRKTANAPLPKKRLVRSDLHGVNFSGIVDREAAGLVL